MQGKEYAKAFEGFVPSHLGKIAPSMPISSSADSKLFTP